RSRCRWFSRRTRQQLPLPSEANATRAAVHVTEASAPAPAAVLTTMRWSPAGAAVDISDNVNHNSLWDLSVHGWGFCRWAMGCNWGRYKAATGRPEAVDTWYASPGADDCAPGQLYGGPRAAGGDERPAVRASSDFGLSDEGLGSAKSGDNGLWLLRKKPCDVAERAGSLT
ncbi:hypothetical protein VaNZ11_001914, partial [Volvox africanus]